MPFKTIFKALGSTFSRVSIASILKKKKILPDRYLLIRPQNGLGNRLRALLSFKIIGDVLDLPVYVLWETGPGFDDTKLEHLIDPESINVNLINRAEWEKYRKQSFNIDEHIAGVYENDIDHASCSVPRPENKKRAEYIRQIFKGEHQRMTVQCTNFMPWAFFIVLVQAYVPDWWRRFLRNMSEVQINGNLFLQIAPTLEKIEQQYTVGLHIRRGDAVSEKNPNKKQYLRSTQADFESIVDIELKNNPDAKIFLTTDDENTLERFKKRYQDKLIYHEKKFVDSSFKAKKQGQLDAMCDMWLLSRTKRIYGTKFSSFSRIASQLNRVKMNVVETDRSEIAFAGPEQIQTTREINCRKTKFNPGFSILTCCMNRNKNLKIALPTWLACPSVDEIVIVDWSSEEKVEDIIPEYTNGKKIKIIRAEEQERWVLSWAFNLGSKFISYDSLAKIDADVLITPDFFTSHLLNGVEFYHGSWRVARTDNELHLNGQLLCKTKDFHEVNGYHEGITSYGWDDDDLYGRLIQKGLDEKYIDNNKIHHLVTKNIERSSGQEEFTEVAKDSTDEELGKILFEETMKNRKWALENPWPKFAEHKNWKLSVKNLDYYKTIITCTPHT
jgi:hypothetical protein